MKYLLDTNVISEARKPSGDHGVKDWLRHQVASELAISVITVLEIDIGIRRLRRHDTASADVLQRWLDDKVLTGFAGRILPLDVAVALRVAPLHVPDPASDHDAIIAGTALAHGLAVVTRNAADFIRSGVEITNPWASDASPAG